MYYPAKNEDKVLIVSIDNRIKLSLFQGITAFGIIDGVRILLTKRMSQPLAIFAIPIICGVSYLNLTNYAIDKLPERYSIPEEYHRDLVGI